MSRTAFVILKSPREQDPIKSVRRFSEQAEASAILLEDGVYQATLKESADRLAVAVSEVLISKEDLEARGFSAEDLKTGKAVGYGEIIECIMERTDRSMTL